MRAFRGYKYLLLRLLNDSRTQEQLIPRTNTFSNLLLSPRLGRQALSIYLPQPLTTYSTVTMRFSTSSIVAVLGLSTHVLSLPTTLEERASLLSVLQGAINTAAAAVNNDMNAISKYFHHHTPSVPPHELPLTYYLSGRNFSLRRRRQCPSPTHRNRQCQPRRRHHSTQQRRQHNHFNHTGSRYRSPGS